MTALLHELEAEQPNYLANIERWRNYMHATMRLEASSLLPFEHRAKPREAITLPILIVMEGTQYNALMRNLSTAGAMFVTSAPIRVHMKIQFQCGTICASGTVVWKRQCDFGFKFDQPICERQLSEQVTRSDAVASWSKRRPLARIT